jgi:hypothetical protein
MSESTGDKLYSGMSEIGKVQSGITLVVVSFIGLLLFVFGVYLLLRKEIHTLDVKAIVERSVCNTVIQSNQSINYRCDLTLKYNVAGKDYTFTGIKDSTVHYPVGSSMDIKVDPVNPMNATFQQSTKTMAWILTCGSVFIILVALGNFYVTTKYKGYAAFSGASTVMNSFTRR